MFKTFYWSLRRPGSLRGRQRRVILVVAGFGAEYYSCSDPNRRGEALTLLSLWGTLVVCAMQEAPRKGLTPSKLPLRIGGGSYPYESPVTRERAERRNRYYLGSH